MADDAAIGPLVKRDGVGGRSRLIIVPDFHIEGEGDQHGGRPGLARAGDPECLEDRAWDLCLVANRNHSLGHRVKQGLVGQAVNLADRSAGSTIHIRDDPDDRYAVEQGLADAAHGVGETRAGHDAEDSDLAGHPGSGVSHDTARGLVGNQEVRLAISLEGVPKLVVLSPGDAEDAADLLAPKSRGGRLGSGHSAVHSLAPGAAPQLDMTGPRRCRCRRGRYRGRGPDQSQSPQRLAAVDLWCHGPYPSWLLHAGRFPYRPTIPTTEMEGSLASGVRIGIPPHGPWRPRGQIMP